MKSIYDPAYIRLVEALRRQRRKLGLSQAAVASKLGVSRTFLIRAEQCERRLDLLETYRLLEVYGLKLQDVADILGRDKHP